MDTRETTHRLQALTRAAESLHNASGVPSTASASTSGLALVLCHADGTTQHVETYYHDGTWRVLTLNTGDEYWNMLYQSTDNERMVQWWAMHMIHFIG